MALFETPTAVGSDCEAFSAGNSYAYPNDFSVLNSAEWYTCSTSGRLILTSNGIPDHDVNVNNPNNPCEIPWFVELPLEPEYVDTITEPANAGIVAIALNGVPIYGAQEAEGYNAVEPSSDSSVTDAQYWYGHCAFANDWHYHHPWAGHSTQPDSSTLIGYAMDGFPLYGPLDDASELDECNGRHVNGSYQYHVRNLDQVDGNVDYCNGESAAIQWNYVIGCYHGDISKTVVGSSLTQSLPEDCEADSSILSMWNSGNASTKKRQDYKRRRLGGKSLGGRAIVV